MIFQFAKVINGKETDFEDKICKCLIENNFEFKGDYETTPYYIVIRKNYDLLQPKIHTIRGDKSNRIKVGTKIQCCNWQGVPYNSPVNQFAPTFECKGIQKIEIKWFLNKENIKYAVIYIDNCIIAHYDNKIIAINDGFDTVEEFFNYFNSDFTGKIIHFTDLKY